MNAFVDDACRLVGYAVEDAVVLLVLVLAIAWADTASACASRAVSSVGREVIYKCIHYTGRYE